MKSLGLPILGDLTYGWKPLEHPHLEVPRVMLHAAHLKFTHPISGQPLALEAPLPPDFQAVIKQLRQASSKTAAKPQRKL